MLPDTTGKAGLFIEDFHKRLYALEAISHVHWSQRVTAPPFLQQMGRSSPIKHLGHASRKVAIARALQPQASLQYGVSSLSWLDIVLQVIEGSKTEASFGQDIQAQVIQLCPEYARRIASWQHVSALATRVAVECFEDSEKLLRQHNIPKATLPQVALGRQRRSLA